MGKISNAELISFIEPNIEIFHKRRLDSLLKLKLKDVLSRKNPYLFRAKNIVTAEQLIKSVLDAYLSSQEEGIFGGFLEELAIFVCSKTLRGRKSAVEGIDLEFDKKSVRHFVVIKSGPNWGNSQQISKMIDNFKKATRIWRTNNSKGSVICVNGCCYGKEHHPYKDDYIKLCGQRFWQFISDDERIYAEIIEPLGYKAREKNDAFNEEYSKVINKFTKEFIVDYCASNGTILWKKLVKSNSGVSAKVQPL